MEVIGLNVNEVVSTYWKKMPAAANGVSRDVLHAHIKCEGSEFRVPVAEGVDIPAGWTGKAVCLGRCFSYGRKFQGDASTGFGIQPVLIQRFEKISQIKAEDTISAFFGTAPSNDSSAPKAPALGGQDRK